MNLTIVGEMIENQLISIHCESDCRPTCETIQWFNGTNKFNSTNEKSISLILTRSMHFNQIICQVNNSIGSTNQSIILYINCKYSQTSFLSLTSSLDRPRFVDQYGNLLSNSSIILIDEFEDISMECFVDSYPPSKIFWSFNNEIVLRNENLFVKKHLSLEKDIGLYQCHAQHSFFGLFNRTIRLAGKYPPELIHNQMIYSTNLGQTIQIICLISNHIPIQVSFVIFFSFNENLFFFSKELLWYKDEHIRIESNEKYQIIENENEEFIQLKLEIRDISLSDQGNYLCQSTNQFGSSKRIFQIKLTNKSLYFLRYFLFYSSITIGIVLSFVFLGILFKHFNCCSNKSSKDNLDKPQEDILLNEQIILQQSLIQNHIQVHMTITMKIHFLFFFF